MTLTDSLVKPPTDDGGEIAFDVHHGGDDAPSTALVFASPHSGRHYPYDMGSALTGLAIRRSEDALVDELIGETPKLGAKLITARFARAYMDVNRQAFELDPSMYADPLPPHAQGRSARVAAGLGAIARLVSEGLEIYDRKLTFAEAQSRIERVHAPYHACLERLLSETQISHGFSILVDWHSMPAAAAKTGGRQSACDMVLGDRFGSACNVEVTRVVERELQSMGYKVARNVPYAGGFTTEFYGRPSLGRHALQIEINRALYLDEAHLTPTSGFGALKFDLERLTQRLALQTWDSLSVA